MKRKLIITLEYEEEWDENDDPEFTEMSKNWSFEDWEDSDWDNVGRPLDHMTDVGWKITNKKIK